MAKFGDLLEEHPDVLISHDFGMSTSSRKSLSKLTCSVAYLLPATSTMFIVLCIDGL